MVLLLPDGSGGTESVDDFPMSIILIRFSAIYRRKR